MLINFTQRAIQTLRIKDLLHDRESREVAEQSDEHTWYCTVLEVYRDAEVLFLVHKPTLFSYPIVLKNFDDLTDPIRQILLQVLMRYEVPAKQIDTFMQASQTTIFAKGDNNRRLLGIMNNMISTIFHIVETERTQGLETDWQALMIKINSMLFGGPDYKFPVEEFVKCYGGKKLGMERFVSKQIQ